MMAEEAGSEALELAVIAPALNEVENIPALVSRLEAALVGIAWELIVVDDDSADGTADRARALGLRDRRVRVIQRIGRRGLSSACIEGALATAAPVVAVIDADLQHDETRLPLMLERLRTDTLDVVVGSRYVEGGGTENWDHGRERASRLATRLGKLAVKADLKDPMSGFFVIRTALMRELAPKLSAVGFKILLDVFASAPEPLKFAEIPYTFRPRTAGESKLDTAIALEYAIILYDKLFGRVLPVRFVLFAFVGGLGVFIHMAALFVMLNGVTRSFTIGQTVAGLAAMTGNFLLNNVLTYRDQRLRGLGVFWGWVSFCVVCSVGLIANVGVASYLYSGPLQSGDAAGLAELVRIGASAMAGILVGAVWNFAVSSRFTWGKY